MTLLVTHVENTLRYSRRHDANLIVSLVLTSISGLYSGVWSGPNASLRLKAEIDLIRYWSRESASLYHGKSMMSLVVIFLMMSRWPCDWVKAESWAEWKGKSCEIIEYLRQGREKLNFCYEREA
ncbi:hypothetical protein TNCT_220911 [Trichonephila clavata]|uniref:Uncharacterized protein n=1 Tax=Trichonephila clavata TaxID=2740835 RepID=A0A8X6KRN9_TRICU|nr:hypothetical protein TNCT_220911 [Trichonephila clavata]